LTDKPMRPRRCAPDSKQPSKECISPFRQPGNVLVGLERDILIDRASQTEQVGVLPKPEYAVDLVSLGVLL
jgi:hypothetical protein